MESCCHQPELPVAHAAELIPAGAEQRRHLPPPGDGFDRIVPMLQGIAVAWLTADPISTAVESTAAPPLHGWRLAWHPAPVPGMASGALVHGQAAVHGFVPPVSMPPPSPREPDPRRR